MTPDPHLGFDWDDLNKSEAISNLTQAVKSLKTLKTGPFKGFLRRSPGGNGYHGLITGKDLLEISTQTLFLIRKSYGDDEMRVMIDRKREKNGIHQDLLFDSYSKEDGKTVFAGKWERIQ